MKTNQVSNVPKERLSLYLPSCLIEEMKKRARKERRSLSNYLSLLLWGKHIDEDNKVPTVPVPKRLQRRT